MKRSFRSGRIAATLVALGGGLLCAPLPARAQQYTYTKISGSLGNVGAPVLNDRGKVVFVAGPTGSRGIFLGDGVYIGPDPVAHKVIAPGDFLDGSTVTNTRISGEALNDNGQIAFSATLADGRTSIYRADPRRSLPRPRVPLVSPN